MNDDKRKRLRLLISQLNKERKRQAKQIDILCNDFVCSQKDFIKALGVISFSADFYEGTAGITDLNELLGTAGRHIQEQIPETNVVFFLLRGNNGKYQEANHADGQTSFEMHIFESGEPTDPLIQENNSEERRIENFFTAELVGNISSSNRVCGIDEMLRMGLQCSGVCLEKISAAALPLTSNRGTPGFILVYRSSQRPLTVDEINCISQITPGLSRSVSACRAASPVIQPAQI